MILFDQFETSIWLYVYYIFQVMEDLALIKAVNHSGSFGKNFVMFMKKKKL